MWTFPSAEDSAPCLKLTLDLMDAWVQGGVTPREVAFIERFLVRSYAFEIDTAAKRLHQALDVFAESDVIISASGSCGAMMKVFYPQLFEGTSRHFDALKLAAKMLPARGHRVVILITDGVNNAGTDPAEVAQWLGAHHIPVYTIGIGTPAGALIPGTDQQATIDEEALRGYAAASGGAYARAENATQLRDALAQLGRVTSMQRKNVDASLGFTVAGALGMLAAFLAGFGLGRYP